jgi:hypothetical protein
LITLRKLLAAGRFELHGVVQSRVPVKLGRGKRLPVKRARGGDERPREAYAADLVGACDQAGTGAGADYEVVGNEAIESA